MHLQFKIKNLGTLNYFLGIEISHSRDGIFLSQQSYCIHLLDDAELLGCKPTSTPFASKTHLHLDSSDPLDDHRYFKKYFITLRSSQLYSDLKLDRQHYQMHYLNTTHE